MFETCPKCGGTAILLEAREDHQEIRLPVKVEEFRCQKQSCEHEFERIIRESPS